MTNTNVPNHIKLEKDLNLPEPLDEFRMLKELRKIADKNQVYRSYIGMGYYDTIVPAVILRNITQNIGWYVEVIFLKEFSQDLSVYSLPGRNFSRTSRVSTELSNYGL